MTATPPQPPEGEHAPPSAAGAAPPSGHPPAAPGGGPPAGPPAPPLRGDPESGPPAWPGWFALVGFVAAITLIVVGGAILAAFSAAAGTAPTQDSPGFNVIGTFIQDAAFVLAALLMAAQVLPPRPWHFGLRQAPLWPAVGRTLAAGAAFLAFQVVYGLVVKPDDRQDVAESLGVDQGAGWLVLGVIVVVVLAPIAEEFFFRGFFYRAVRNGLVPKLGERRGVLAAAAIGGAVFGLIHIEPLVALPQLAVFGFVLCLLYERTGSLYAPIALHALNNTFAFSLLAEDSAEVAIPVGLAVVAACAALPRVLHGRAPRAGAAPA